MKNLGLFLTISCFSFVHVAAQKPLTAEDEKFIKSQAIEYIKVFKNNLQELGSSNNLSDKEKNVMITFTLSYFEKGSTVEVMNRRRKNTYEIAYYLKNIVANYNKRFSVVYTTIDITSFNTGDLIPIKDAKGNITSYKCSFSYVQGFCAKRNPVNNETFNSKDPENYDVCDKTWKTGEVIIEKKYSPTLGVRWIVLLGSIKATKIEDIKNG